MLLAGLRQIDVQLTRGLQHILAQAEIGRALAVGWGCGLGHGIANASSRCAYFMRSR
jgi:hypothetical protein